MKKYVVCMMLALMMIFCGCPDAPEKNDESTKMNVMRPDVKAGSVFMEHYFSFLMARKFNIMGTFYGKLLKNKIKNQTVVIEPHPEGYHIHEGEIEKNDILFNVDIYNGYSNKPYYSQDEFIYTLGLENGRSVIKDIQKKKSTEIFENNGEILKMNGEEMEAQKLVSLSELPKYVTPVEAVSGHKKLPLPVKKFSAIALSPDKKTLAFTTYDKNTFVGIIKTGDEEEVETLMQEGNKAGGQGGQGGQESTGNSQGNGAQAPKLKIKNVDLLYNTIVHNICFSPDGKKFVIQYSSNKKPSQLIMYDSQSGNMINFKTDIQFADGLYYFNNPYFESADELVFTLVPVKNSPGVYTKNGGVWQLDLSKGKLKKLEI